MCAAPDEHLCRRLPQQRGTTLVEVILFILIVSIALTAVVNALSVAVRQSADPLIQRQTLGIAESLIQEIDNQPYAQKDPYNPTGPDDAIGPEVGETRAGSPLPFDNPNDYSGYSESGIVAPDGTSVAGLGTYSASVIATQQAMGNVPASDGLLLVVTATGPDGQAVTLTSFRARYAP
jgi:MSHA pilin protein MshD